MNIKIISIIFLSILILSGAFFFGTSCQPVSLDEMIGQMLVIGFRGTDIKNNSVLQKDIAEKKIGGVILYDLDYEALIEEAKQNSISVLDLRRLMKSGAANFDHLSRNVESPEQVKKLTISLQNLAAHSSSEKLLICVDREGGMVDRLGSERGFEETVSQKQLAGLSVEQANLNAKKYAATLKDAGINFVFSPVVDLEIDQDNPVIAKLERSFSRDPGIVVTYAEILMNAYENNNIAYSLKHFPGHGSSTSDSHLGFVDLSNTWIEEELIPYHALLGNRFNYGATVMTAHVVNKKLDDSLKPATLSKKTLDVLRTNVGFPGIVVTDDLQMLAISQHYQLDDAVYLAIDAGNDLLLFGNQIKYEPQIASKVIAAVKKQIANGKLSTARIKKSYEKIRTLKKWLST